MSKPNKCPHCGGTSGFEFSSTASYRYRGEWGNDADRIDESETMNNRGQATCIDCNETVDIEFAEGK